jgi:hypothetical protein
MNWYKLLELYTVEELFERADLDVLEVLADLEALGYFDKLDVEEPL